MKEKKFNEVGVIEHEIERGEREREDSQTSQLVLLMWAALSLELPTWVLPVA